MPSLHSINLGRPRSILADFPRILSMRAALGILLGDDLDGSYFGDDDFGGFDDFDF
jgi:hypothetical protein